jgi:hypothetical protein
MSRTTNKIIKGVALAFLVGGVLAPSAGADTDPFARTPTERAQAVGEPGEQTSAAQTDSRQSQRVSGGLGRTPTEIGQAVGEPGDSNVAAAVLQPGDPIDVASPAGQSDGFDWGDAAIGAGLALILGIGALAVVSRRRGVLRKLRTPVTSS